MNSFSIEQVLNRHPLIINPSTPLIETIGLMNQSNVASCHLEDNDSEFNSLIRPHTSCALVIEDGQLLGIFTERDLVRLTAEGKTLAEMTVGEAMTQPIITFESTEVQDLFAILNMTNQHKIRHLPIVDNNKQLLGIITPEVVQRSLQPMDWLRFQRVGEVMSNSFIHALPTVSVLRVTQLMVQHQVSCVVITEDFEYYENSELEIDEENSPLRPVGIITERDIIQFQTLELNLGQIQAQTLMSKPLFLVSPEDSLWSAHQQMQQLRVRRLIVAGEQGELKGIITQKNLLQALDPKEMYGVLELLQSQVCQLEIEKSEFLQSRTEELEKEVKKRTYELEKANQQLQQEIRERQQKETKIREQAALIDIASDAIFVRDLSNRILFWSQGAERLYGWKAEDIIGQEAYELFESEFSSQLESAFNMTIKQGSWSGELKQLTKEGQEIIVASRWTLMRDPQANPQSILVVNTDITEKKQLTAQLLHSQRLESIGTLAGGIAHDLNNILTPILGFTQLLPLKNPDLDESTVKLLQLIQANALRGANIVKQVLLFSQSTEAEWESVLSAQLIEEVLKLIRETFPKSIVIEEYISPNLWQVYGDATQLHQVLMNLCVNSRDAMPDGGKLVISAENLSLDEQYSSYTNLDLEVGNYILISVTDTGIGIAKNIIDRIFDPFFTTKEPGQGTGLGLSTAIGIIKNHGGVIEVKSDPGSGTQFKIYLPASESITTTEIVTGETIPSGQEELILVVDDETPIREVTKATLENYNYRVITASDGIEAIAIYAQQLQEIKVVLMDLTMPEIDGLTAMRALKKINSNIKLIATSGLATKEKIAAAELIGIKAFLVKPYTAEKLLLNLAKVIETND